MSQANGTMERGDVAPRTSHTGFSSGFAIISYPQLREPCPQRAVLINDLFVSNRHKYTTIIIIVLRESMQTSVSK